jgi:drug/metabolite transporter (DMT)-like permease
MRGSAVDDVDVSKSAGPAVLITLLASLLYGSQYVVIKEGIVGINPLFFGAVTTGLGGLLALAYITRRRHLDLRMFRRWEVWAGTLAATAMIACQYTGLTISSASVGGLIVGSNVIFVAPLSALLFKEVIGWRGAAGVVLGLVGLFTITTGWDLSSFGSGAMAGYILLLVASFCIAATYPLTKLATRHMGYMEWVMSFHLLSSVFLLVLAALTGGPGQVGSPSVVALLYVGGLCTSLPTMLWAKGLQSLSFTTSATILMSESAFAVILGTLVLREPLDSVALLGAAMVFAAIFLAARSGASGQRAHGTTTRE